MFIMCNILYTIFLRLLYLSYYIAVWLCNMMYYVLGDIVLSYCFFFLLFCLYDITLDYLAYVILLFFESLNELETWTRMRVQDLEYIIPFKTAASLLDLACLMHSLVSFVLSHFFMLAGSTPWVSLASSRLGGQTQDWKKILLCAHVDVFFAWSRVVPLTTSECWRKIKCIGLYIMRLFCACMFSNSIWLCPACLGSVFSVLSHKLLPQLWCIGERRWGSAHAMQASRRMESLKLCPVPEQCCAATPSCLPLVQRYL